jgi:hypothetical protein
MGEDFRLDSKKPEDKKKIDQGKAVFDKFLTCIPKF